eukprot:1160353-Pelagomonas_calceolata.AAC.11
MKAQEVLEGMMEQVGEGWGKVGCEGGKMRVERKEGREQMGSGGEGDGEVRLCGRQEEANAHSLLAGVRVSFLSQEL